MKKWFDPSLPPIRGDRAQLTQVFLNLVKNAFQAMAGGGALTVTTRLETDYHVREHGTAPNRFIWVDLADEGCGIREEDLRISSRRSSRPKITALDWVWPLAIASSKNMAARSGSKASKGRGSIFRVSLVVAD